MVDIGNKIKELRTEQKMTQSDLAERLGVTKSSISSYENGSRLPSYDILLKIARIFKECFWINKRADFVFENFD